MGTGFAEAKSLFEHEHHVMALAVIPPGKFPRAPRGGFVTGCKDTKVRVYDADGALRKLLQGHQKEVSSLSWAASGELLTGSWDGTARVWQLFLGAPAAAAPRAARHHLDARVGVLGELGEKLAREVAAHGGQVRGDRGRRGRHAAGDDQRADLHRQRRALLVPPRAGFRLAVAVLRGGGGGLRPVMERQSNTRDE